MRAMHYRHVLWVTCSGLLSFAWSGCSSSSNGATTCTPGTERCACAATDACNSGLACLDKVCIAAGGSGGQSSSGTTGQALGGGGTSSTPGGTLSATSIAGGATPVSSAQGGASSAGGGAGGATSVATVGTAGGGTSASNTGGANASGGNATTSLGGDTTNGGALTGGISAGGGTLSTAGASSTGGSSTSAAGNSNGGMAANGGTSQVAGGVTNTGGAGTSGLTQATGGATNAGGAGTGGLTQATGGDTGAGGTGTGGASLQLGPNLVNNGDFSQGTTDWHVTDSSGNDLTTDSVNSDGAYCIGNPAITNGTQVIGWPVAVEDAAYLQASTTYALSFRAMSSSSYVYINPKVGEAISPYSDIYYLDRSYAQTTTWQTIQVTFSTNSNYLATTPVGIAFTVYNVDYDTTVCIDDVVLAKVGG